MNPGIKTLIVFANPVFLSGNTITDLGINFSFVGAEDNLNNVLSLAKLILASSTLLATTSKSKENFISLGTVLSYPVLNAPDPTFFVICSTSTVLLTSLIIGSNATHRAILTLS